MADPRMPGFGDSASVQQMADAAEQTTRSLEDLRALVQKDVSATLRQAFEGEAATSFEGFANRLSDAIIPGGGVGSPTRVYHEKIKPAAAAMKEAERLLKEAEQYARDNRLFIRSDLRVEAMDPNRPDAQALVAVGQGKLDAARKAAEAARQQVRDANAAFGQALAMSQGHLNSLGMASGRGRGRPRTRLNEAAKTSKSKAWEAHEKSEADRDKQLDRQYTLEYERGKDYRQDLMRTYPMPRDGREYVAHHNLPVEHSPKFAKVGIDTTNPIWGSWVERRQHELFSAAYGRDWDTFFTNNPNPSRDHILAWARHLSGKYNYQIGF